MPRKLFFLLFGIGLIISLSHPLKCQTSNFNYYLPDVTYDVQILNPEEYFGFLPGEWHLSFDQVRMYMLYLAQKSPRAVLKDYARSHEKKVLFYLIISDPDHIEQLGIIRNAHKDLANPVNSNAVDIGSVPAVVNLGYSVHGNEQSGMHAAVYVAYYLAAAQSPEMDRILKSNVILLDPCMNPDGTQRFTTWVNMNRSANLNSEPASREFNEWWPGGRGNHYWFDLNRDWIAAVQPESRGRIQVFHEWLPNIVCDFHEMGSGETYFFQPGVPSRTNPMTPSKNQELTASIAHYHARALDQIGSTYFTKETFDDYFYGKGSTYPDINGSVGILFEQASSRGHLQRTNRGLLSFPFTIRNQIITSLSTLTASTEMRLELLEYKREFYREALNIAPNDSIRGWICHFDHDLSITAHFLDILNLHQIKVYQTGKNLVIGNQNYPAKSLYIPYNQRQYRLIKSIFEPVLTFRDSIFYDISVVNLPMSFGSTHAAVLRSAVNAGDMEISALELVDLQRTTGNLPYSGIGYLMTWSDYVSPYTLKSIMNDSILVMAVQKESVYKTLQGNYRARPGDLFIPAVQDGFFEEQIHQIVQKLYLQTGIPIHSIESGMAISGSDAGSASNRIVKAPKPILLVGTGISGTEAGEVWHHLDINLGISPTLLDAQNWNRAKLHQYSHVILCGSPALDEKQINELKNWLTDGGVIIGIGNGNSWLKSQKLAFLSDTIIKNDSGSSVYVPYEQLSQFNTAKQINGAIFRVKIDNTHPLFYGIRKGDLAIFHRGVEFYKNPSNKNAAPAYYADDLLLSGYVHSTLKDKFVGRPYIVVSGHRSGRVISFLDNPLYRGQWPGTARIFNNALFFGSLIQLNTTQTSFE
jgi:hypothetical protein